MRSSLSVGLLALATVVPLITGCSSLGLDDDDDTPPPPAATAAETVAPATETAAPAPAPAALPSAVPTAGSPVAGAPVAGSPAAGVPAAALPAAGAPGQTAATAAGTALWAKNCVKNPAGGDICFVEQFAIANPQRTVLLHIRVGYLGAEGKPRIVIVTPLGVHLPPGVSLSLDDKEPLLLPYDSCQPSGCLVIADLNQEALHRFTTGTTLTVRYIGSDKGKLDIPIQLKGLGEALKGVPAPGA